MNTDNEVRIEQVIDAPREEVFRAWTEPDQLKQWWGPGGYTTEYAEVDLRTGGRYLLVMKPPDGEPFHLAGTYREIVAPERLVYTWKWEVGVPDPAESLVTVDFEDVGDATRVTVTHGEFQAGLPTDQYLHGWTSGLEKLTGYLSTRSENGSFSSRL